MTAALDFGRMLSLKPCGGIYWRTHYEANDISLLSSVGVRIVNVDAALFLNEAAFLSAMGVAFAFPDYYGRNWDAMLECLGAVLHESKTPICLIVRRANVLATYNPSLLVALGGLFVGLDGGSEGQAQLLALFVGD